VKVTTGAADGADISRVSFTEDKECFNFSPSASGAVLPLPPEKRETTGLKCRIFVTTSPLLDKSFFFWRRSQHPKLLNLSGPMGPGNDV
jgi:hypothetical protein